VHRDYAPQGVKFFFIYKRLAHPELVGGYVQPFTLEERIEHAQVAQRRLGASIPWLVDAIDNRLCRALGNRANSEFIVDPQGKIARKRAWSDPAQVRADLEQLVGPVERITREEDIQLEFEFPAKAPAPHGTTPRIQRAGMQALVIEPKIESGGQPFFAKLRAEADSRLIGKGDGKLYLGFHLDPLHDAHWNNLTEPLTVRLETPEGVQTKALTLRSPKASTASDADPREFLLEIGAWKTDEPIRLTVSYFACLGDTECRAIEQQYEIHRQVDEFGGNAQGAGAGYWEFEVFAEKALARDRNGDGKLTRKEAQGLIRPHFGHFDANGDGFLEREELRTVVDWLNGHHRPGAPKVEEAPSSSR
jgi:hypothetical protein